MRILYSWLNDFIDTGLTPEQLAGRLTALGIEVAEIKKTGAQFTGVKTAQILAIGQHPNADKLSLVDIDDGAGKTTVVCGAKNIAVGQIVPLARVGAKLPEGELKKAKIRGVESEGMICSSGELGFGDDGTHGILVFPAGTPIGKNAAEMFGDPDCVFELEITANRPDLMSHLGIARELGILLNLPVKMPQAKPSSGKECSVKISIDAPDACPRYTGRVIKNVSTAQSPDWMKKRLEAMGTNPKNILVDVTNYILYEVGQPLHAFDLNYIDGGEIRVRRAAEGEKFTALDEKALELNTEALVIAGTNNALALAGIIGGLGSGIKDDTKDVFLESACFEPQSVHKTSRKFGYKTEAAQRFERGADVGITDYAIRRATDLITEICGAQAEPSAVCDVYPTVYEPKRVAVEPEKINALLGTDIAPEKMRDIFAAMGPSSDFSVTPWQFVAPSHRRDLAHRWDLAEEVARFVGYDAIPDDPRPALVAFSEDPKGIAFARKLRDSFSVGGFYEVENYDFVSAKELGAISVPVKGLVEVANPLSADWQYLRPTLLNGLLKTLSYNENRGTSSAWLFEVGKVYAATPGQPKETLHCAGLVCGTVPNELCWQGAKPVDFFHLKGLVANALRNVQGLAMRPAQKPAAYMHPKLCMELLVGNKEVGYFGKLHPLAAEQSGVRSKDLWYFEFSVDDIAKHSGDALKREIKPVSAFPAAWRDISVLIDKTAAYEQVEAAIRKASGEELTAVALADRYDGKGIPEGKHSLSLRLTYSLKDRTLTDPEIDAAVKKALDALSSAFGAALRS